MSEDDGEEEMEVFELYGDMERERVNTIKPAVVIDDITPNSQANSSYMMMSINNRFASNMSESDDVEIIFGGDNASSKQDLNSSFGSNASSL